MDNSNPLKDCEEVVSINKLMKTIHEVNIRRFAVKLDDLCVKLSQSMTDSAVINPQQYEYTRGAFESASKIKGAFRELFVSKHNGIYRKHASQLEYLDRSVKSGLKNCTLEKCREELEHVEVELEKLKQRYMNATI